MSRLLALNGTRVSTTCLSDAQTVVLTPEEFAEFLNLDALVQVGLDGQLILLHVVAITPVDGARGLIADELRSVAQDNPVGFCTRA